MLDTHPSEGRGAPQPPRSIQSYLFIFGGLMLLVGIAAVETKPALIIAAAVASSVLLAIGLYGLRAGRQIPVSVSETALVTADDETRNLIAVLDLPALTIDAANRVMVHNTRAQLIFPKIAAGQPLYQVSRNPGLLDAVEACRRDGAPHVGEISERTPLERRFLITVAALGRADGTLLIQLRDVSEQDRLTQLRSDFIANASHELRTPLASLKGFIETLQGPASGDEKARDKFLKIMATQAARMARILDDLLSLSRIEMHAHVPPQEEVDVNVIVRAVVQGLEPIADDSKIALHLTTPETPSIVRGDSDELEQVFRNLIENAIKYGKQDGKVEIGIRRLRYGRAEERISVAVTDDGPGIAEEHLPRLTERFYRVDTASSRERGGTGLGLAIVKHILNRHQGNLEMVSQLGRGSTFTVNLDAAQRR